MTTNIFEAVLGDEAIKWDAFGHFFEWLLDDKEGHGLGECIREELLKFVFCGPNTQCMIWREYPVSGQTDGKGKWADLALGIPDFTSPTHLILMDDISRANAGGKRKLVNLKQYAELSLEKHSKAIVRAVAVTDAPKNYKFPEIVYDTLGNETQDASSPIGWKMLHLETVGEWTLYSINFREQYVSIKMKSVLEDFAAWCKSRRSALRIPRS